MSIHDELKKLNSPQRAAATHAGGPCLVLAGPGTGKTRVLTNRIRFLADRYPEEAGRILALTFTNKAAGEIRERLSGTIIAAAPPVTGTIHKLGMQILQRHAPLLGRTPDFSIIDESVRKQLLRDHCGAAPRSLTPLIIQISHAKHRAVLHGDQLPEPALRYEQALQTANSFDFDDLILKPLHLLQTNPEVQRLWNQRFRWLLIDEFQDLNPAQYRLLRQLAPEPAADIFAIGDPNQAIYGFRGADNGLIGQFEQDYPDCRRYALATSYRCPQSILTASHQMLAAEQTPLLQGVTPGIRIGIRAYPSDRSEAEGIARTIVQLLGGTSFFSLDSGVSSGTADDPHLSPCDIAILCRTRAQFPAIEHALLNHGIPYLQTGTGIAFNTPAQQRMIRFLYKLYNPLFPLSQPEQHLWNRSGIDPSAVRTEPLPKQIEIIAGTTQAHHDLHLSESERREMTDSAQKFGTDDREWLAALILETELDRWQPQIHCINLMTLHSAKGLEFRCVFIPGCEDKLLPYSLFADRQADPEEERRLFYVGMTRSQYRLYLSHSQRRHLYNREYLMNASPFLQPIRQELAERQQHQLPIRKTKKEKQLKLF